MQFSKLNVYKHGRAFISCMYFAFTVEYMFEEKAWPFIWVEFVPEP